MKLRLLIVGLLGIMLLAGCGRQPRPAAATPAPTVAPTEAPAEPTAAPTEAATEAAPAEEAPAEEAPSEAAPAEEAPAAEAPAAEAAPAELTAPPSAFAFDTTLWQSVECDTFGVDPLLVGLADCGYVTVPENRAAGTDSTIQLGVVRLRSISEEPGSPLFLATGGPGGAGMTEATTGRAPAFLGEKGPILEDRDWVFFTQRGTQFAIPELNCPAYDSLPIQAADGQWSLEERGERSKEAILGCAEELRAQGVDLAGYNTNENAADVKDIVQALGYDQIMLYGESYGTQLAQFVMRNHPEVLEAVILDGVVPVTAERYSDITDFPGAFRRVFAACEADEACNAAYPNLEQLLTELMNDLRAEPQTFTLGQPPNQQSIMMDDLLAMNALFIQLFMPDGYAKLPEIIYQLRDGDTSGFNFSLPGFLSVNSSARVMNFAINCADLGMDSMEQIGLEGMPEVFARLDQEDGQQYVLVCAELGVPALGPESDALVESEIPTLILQGAFDPATPISGGDNVATGLPNSFNVIVPRGTHIQSHNPCVIDIMRAFLTDPAAEPDTSCLEPEPAFTFPGRVGYTDPASGATISFEVASTWQSVGQGQWSNGDMLVIAAAYGPTKTVEATMAETLNALSVTDAELVDGPVIAGLPSITFQGEMAGNPIDVFVFGDETGSYRLILDSLKPDRLEFLRTVAYPALLESVTVGVE